MAKRVIFAVAGSGKTTLLIDRLKVNSRTLILTHTINNETHLRSKIINLFGFMPEGIRVMTWFEFLHGFCFRPFLREHLASRGLSFPSRHRGSHALTDCIIRIIAAAYIIGGLLNY